MTNAIIDQITDHFEPEDQAERVIIRAAVAAAVDITHETGDLESFRAFVIKSVSVAFGRYWGCPAQLPPLAESLEVAGCAT